MKHGCIAVGLDGSAPARHALAWAVGEARRLGTGLLIVTAWPDEARRCARIAGRLRAERTRLQQMQVECIAAAVRAAGPCALISRELILADPVTALCHAAKRSDLVVVGGVPGRSRPSSIAGRVTTKLAARQRPDGSGPVWTVVPSPTGRTVAARRDLTVHDGRASTPAGASTSRGELCRSGA